MFLSQEVVGFTPGKSAFQSQGSCPWQRCDQRCRTLVNGGRKREDQSRARPHPQPDLGHAQGAGAPRPAARFLV